MQMPRAIVIIRLRMKLKLHESQEGRNGMKILSVPGFPIIERETGASEVFTEPNVII
jgi:hypothetical protein